jgi:hypothetical protein
MVNILKNIFEFITDTRNTRMILFALVVIFVLLFLRQCGKTSDAKIKIAEAKEETKRISNNLDAFRDTINSYKLDENTWRSEKQIYELTQNELKEKYSELLGKFEYEKNKPPKTIIKTEYVIKEIINEVIVNGTVDSLGNANLAIADSLVHDSLNYRYLNGSIPAKISHDSSGYSITTSPASFSLEQGMSLNFGLFKDKKTNKITLKVDTDYPGITFTQLNGANILDDPKNKKILRQTRKNWSIGVNAGYGVFLDPSKSSLGNGVYLGIGLTYSPKFLQW